MTGFRSLGENEIVNFKSRITDRGAEAMLVTGLDKKQLEGSSKNKKRFRKTRCVQYTLYILFKKQFESDAHVIFIIIFQMLQLWKIYKSFGKRL